MDNTRRAKNILIAVCLLSLLGFWGGTDHVTKQPDIQKATSIQAVYFDGCPTNGMFQYEDVDSVQWFLQDGEYYLFLPSGIDNSQLSVYIEADGYVETSKGQRLDSGYHEITFEEGMEELSLFAGAKQYRLHVLQSDHLDSFFMATDSGNMDFIHEDKENEEEAYLLAMGADQQKVYEGLLSKIKGHGNSTWASEKKSYTIKLDREADLLKSEKMHENWVLLANSVDVQFQESLLRNAVAFSLAREMDGTGNSIQYKFVDLYLNGEYTGIYQLCEKIQIGDNGIAVANLEKQMKTLNSKELFEYESKEAGIPDEAGHRRWTAIPVAPEDITGGYLLEMDGRYLEEPNGFDTGRQNEFTVKNPKYCSFGQMGYIADRIQDLEDAIYAPTGRNSKGYSYLDYIDLESFAEYYVLSELLINPDTYRYSTYLYKDIDTAQGFGRLFAGPAWDFDRSAGCVDETQDYQTLFLKERPWIEALLEKEEFLQEVKRIYAEELRPFVIYMTGGKTGIYFDRDSSMFVLGDLAVQLEAAGRMNQIRWAGHLPTDVTEEAEEIRMWLLNRISWLDGLETDNQS